MTIETVKTKNRVKKSLDSNKDLKRAPVQKLEQTDKQGLDQDQRLEMISVAAYYIAERNGFTPELNEVNWILAEKQIDNIDITM